MYNQSISNIEITTESDYTHEVILFTHDKNQAIALRASLGESVIISYIKSNPRQLHFELPYINSEFFWKMPDTVASIMWQDWIDAHKVTFCWVAYLNENWKPVFVGTSVPLIS